METSRRTILIRRLLAVGAVLGLAVAAKLIINGAGSLVSADKQGADLTEIEISSASVGQDLPVNVVVPQGAEGDERPLLVFLHGRGSDGEESNLDDAMYAALADQGDRAPIVAFPNGGEASYWHDRDSGDWGTYVVDEVIPQVAEQFGADPKRVAIGGISMGGFGAYDLARVNPGRFCAVGGHSPALWQTAGETAEGAFDDAEDFAAYDVIATAESDPGPFLSQAVWIDAGEADPFSPGIEAFTTALETAGAPLTSTRPPGGHEGSYWDAHFDEYMRFYARSLDAC